MKTKQAIIEHIKEESDFYWKLLKIEEEKNGKTEKYMKLLYKWSAYDELIDFINSKD